MERIDSAIKLARDCHTKVAWEDFLQRYGDLLATCPQPRLVTEVFKRLSEDRQSLNYNPALWAALLQGSRACWNIEAGCSIAEFVKKLTVSSVAVPATQLLLEGGHPAASREYAQRALRGSSLGSLDRLQLEMIVASSFAEEGKIEKAIKILEQLGPSVRESDIPKGDRANLLDRLGRLYFFTGRYLAAAKSWEEAAPLFQELKEWEYCARSLYNAGACYQNSGAGSAGESYRMVEECRKIAAEHNLPGPLSACDSFYGVEAYHSGVFASAREHFRRALSVLPANDKSFRRLHILSMLSLTYFATGKYTLAKKFGQQTLDLAALDESERFKTRYQALEAEILWEDGKVAESMDFLKTIVAPMENQGVHTLEELSTLTRYNIQSAMSGLVVPIERYRIDEQLRHNRHTWLEFEYSCALLRSNSVSSKDALTGFQACLAIARDINARQFEALSLLGVVLVHLRGGALEESKKTISELEVVLSRLGDSPIRAKLQLVYASIAYHEGDFDRCVKILGAVEKMAAVSFPDLFAAQCCLATIKGHSPKLLYDWQLNLVARFVRYYFAPTLAMPEPRVFVISNHYTVNLEKHPSLAELLTYLVERPAQGALATEVQTEVWKQSLNTQGWQQKIRNAIMRIRDLFPYTIAPILLHDDGEIRFFAAAIALQNSYDDQISDDVRAKQLLLEGPLSSQQLGERMGISLATAKRLLRKLTDENKVGAEKHGRNVVYRINTTRAARGNSASIH